MLATFIILAREGLEASLLVGILIAYLRQLDALNYVKWIFVGVLAGVLAAIGAVFILEFIVNQFHNQTYRLMLTAGIMLLAAGVLCYMTIWMQKQSKEMTGAAKDTLRKHVAAGNLFGIAFLAFVSVWREAMETILFLSALSYGGTKLSPIGGALGLTVAIFGVWLLMRGTRHIPIAMFFRWSSLLLTVIAAGLLSSATNILQGTEILPGSTTPLFDMSFILSDKSGVGSFLRGLFGYDASPTPLQFGVWSVFLVVSIALWFRAYRPKPKSKAA